MTLNARERLLAELGVVAVIACIAALFGWVAPPGTPLGARLAIALAGFIASWALVRALAVIGAATARLLGLHSVWGYALAIPFASAAIAWFALWQIAGPDAALGDAFSRVWPQTILIGLGFFALFFVIYWRAHVMSARAKTGIDTPKKEAAPIDEPGVPTSSLHGHLPPGFPAILALSVEDHYVHVIAQDRHEMLLMPLGDAIELMPPGSGEQVHRSWWVASSAVTGHRREGRDTKLELAGGREAPVSRSMVPQLRQAGWLSND